MSDAEDEDDYVDGVSGDEGGGGEEEEAEEQQQIQNEEEEEEEEKGDKKKRKKKRKLDEDEEGDGEEGDGYKEEEYHGEKMSRFYVQHGAHREYAVPQEFVAHEAQKFVKVKSGEEIAELIRYTGIKYWANLKWYHVTILAGQNLTTKERDVAPYVCLNVPGNDATDDPNWLRPIAPAVMKHFMPEWKKQIKEKYSDKQECKAVLKQYDMVLNWDEKSAKLDPAKLGVGRGGFKQLRHKKLKSLRTPDIAKAGPGRGGKKQATGGGSKAKAGPASEAGSSADTACVAWAVPDGKVFHLPGAMHCFKSDTGNWYAVYTE